MIESVVFHSLINDLITITELFTEESSPGIWYCSVDILAVSSRILPPVSGDGIKDGFKQFWIEGWI